MNKIIKTEKTKRSTPNENWSAASRNNNIKNTRVNVELRIQINGSSLIKKLC